MRQTSTKLWRPKKDKVDEQPIEKNLKEVVKPTKEDDKANQTEVKKGSKDKENNALSEVQNTRVCCTNDFEPLEVWDDPAVTPMKAK